MPGRPTLYLMLLLLLSLPSSAVAMTPPGLEPVGTGNVRYLGLIKVYEATLFAAPGATEAGILGGEKSICLQLNYVVDLAAENFVQAAETILARQHQPTTLAPLQEELDLIHRSYRDVRSGDYYRLCYDADRRQTRLELNGELLTTIDSVAFATIYFGIWLNRHQPLDTSLRTKLFAHLPPGESS